MSKRVSLDDDELYILKQFVQDNLNETLLKSYWVFQQITHAKLKKLMKKLEETNKEKE